MVAHFLNYAALPLILWPIRQPLCLNAGNPTVFAVGELRRGQDFPSVLLLNKVSNLI